MVDASSTKESYIRVCNESIKEPKGEILAVLNRVNDEQIL